MNRRSTKEDPAAIRYECRRCGRLTKRPERCSKCGRCSICGHDLRGLLCGTCASPKKVNPA